MRWWFSSWVLSCGLASALGSCAPVDSGAESVASDRQTAECIPGDAEWERIRRNFPSAIEQASGHVDIAPSGFEVDSRITLGRHGVSNIFVSSTSSTLDTSSYEVRIRRLGCKQYENAWSPHRYGAPVNHGLGVARWLVEVYEPLETDSGEERRIVHARFMLASPKRMEQFTLAPTLPEAIQAQSDFTVEYDQTHQTRVWAKLRGYDGSRELSLSLAERADNGNLVFPKEQLATLDPQFGLLEIHRTRHFEVAGQITSDVTWSDTLDNLSNRVAVPNESLNALEETRINHDRHVINIDKCSEPEFLRTLAYNLYFSEFPPVDNQWPAAPIKPDRVHVVEQPSLTGLKELNIRWTTRHGAWNDTSKAVAAPLKFELDVEVVPTLNRLGTPAFGNGDIEIVARHVGCTQFDADENLIWPEHSGLPEDPFTADWVLQRSMLGGSAEAFAEAVYKDEQSAIPLQLDVYRRYGEVKYRIASVLLSSAARNQTLTWDSTNTGRFVYERSALNDHPGGPFFQGDTFVKFELRSAQGVFTTEPKNDAGFIKPSWNIKIPEEELLKGISNVLMTRQYRVDHPDEVVRYRSREKVVLGPRALINWPSQWLAASTQELK